MLIIIEGIDRTGKSTLAANIAAATDSQVWHAVKPTKHPLEEYEVPLATYEPFAQSGGLVIDRWHVGELVWPRIFNRASEFDAAMFAHVELFLVSRGALLVYATRRDAVNHLFELAEHDEPTADGVLFLEAKRLYQEALMMCATAHVFYDHSLDDDALKNIITLAGFGRRAVQPLHMVTSEWIGMPRPDAILVGERFGPAHGKRPAAPVPFVPFRGTSGHFLFTELTRSDLWRQVAIVNAFKGDGSSEELGAFHDLAGSPKIVALGKAAAKELRRQGLEFAEVPHPQYVRRFQRKQGPGWYHELLREATA